VQKGLVYKYDSLMGTWVKLAANTPSPPATATTPGTMTATDLVKLNRLLIPPPLSTIVGNDCTAPFSKGHVSIYNGDNILTVRGDIDLKNVDQYGDNISVTKPFKIRDNTYALDFTLDLDNLVTELKKRGQFKVTGEDGDLGIKGPRGNDGLNDVPAGPQGLIGNPGISPPCDLNIDTEPFAAAPHHTLKKALVAARVVPSIEDPTKYVIEFDRQVVGDSTAGATRLNVKSDKSVWVLALATINATPQAAYYIDIEAIIDPIYNKYVTEAERIKGGYEDITQYWVNIMNELFDEQKEAICCALEYCLSATKGSQVRQHMENVAATAAAGGKKIRLHGRNSEEAVSISSMRRLHEIGGPDHEYGGGADRCYDGGGGFPVPGNPANPPPPPPPPVPPPAPPPPTPPPPVPPPAPPPPPGGGGFISCSGSHRLFAGTPLSPYTQYNVADKLSVNWVGPTGSAQSFTLTYIINGNLRYHQATSGSTTVKATMGWDSNAWENLPPSSFYTMRIEIITSGGTFIGDYKINSASQFVAGIAAGVIVPMNLNPANSNGGNVYLKGCATSAEVPQATGECSGANIITARSTIGDALVTTVDKLLVSFPNFSGSTKTFTVTYDTSNLLWTYSDVSYLVEVRFYDYFTARVTMVDKATNRTYLGTLSGTGGAIQVAFSTQFSTSMILTANNSNVGQATVKLCSAGGSPPPPPPPTVTPPPMTCQSTMGPVSYGGGGTPYATPSILLYWDNVISNPASQQIVHGLLYTNKVSGTTFRYFYSFPVSPAVNFELLVQGNKITINVTKGTSSFTTFITASGYEDCITKINAGFNVMMKTSTGVNAGLVFVQGCGYRDFNIILPAPTVCFGTAAVNVIPQSTDTLVRSTDKMLLTVNGINSFFGINGLGVLLSFTPNSTFRGTAPNSTQITLTAVDYYTVTLVIRRATQEYRGTYNVFGGIHSVFAHSEMYMTNIVSTNYPEKGTATIKLCEVPLPQAAMAAQSERKGLPRSGAASRPLLEVDTKHLEVSPLLNPSIATASMTTLEAGEYIVSIESTDAEVDGIYRSDIRVQYMKDEKFKAINFPYKGSIANADDGKMAYEGLTAGFIHSGGVIKAWLPVIAPISASGDVRIRISKKPVELAPIENLIEEMAAPVSQVPTPPTECRISRETLQQYSDAWESGQCCGLVVSVAGQDYILVKRSIGEDTACGGGESANAPHILYAGDRGHPAIAWPTFDGQHFAPIPNVALIKYDYIDNMNAAVIASIQSSFYSEPKGNPNGIRHLMHQLTTVLFPML